MISPEKAIDILKSISVPGIKKILPLEKCLGHILAESLVADRDFPPFNRVMMDGICVNNLNQNEWLVEGIVYAGDAKSSLKNPEAAIEIMTGAALPENCQAVIQVEQVEFFHKNEQKWVRLKENTTIISGQFIHFQGMDAKKDEEIIANNTLLGGIEIALAASIGKSTLSIFGKPRIGIFSTGDEIVGIDAIPKEHQIRASNSYMMKAKLEAMSFETEMDHLPDHKESIYETLKKSLENNQVLLLSGGVSAGKKDFIPEVLSDLGFETLFHKIAQKPGKPLWVGKNKIGQVIFAFPGNPISTLVCFFSYFLPWIQHKNTFMGNLQLTKAPKALENLSHWIPVKENRLTGEFEHLKHNGSGDLIHWQLADALVYQKPKSSDAHLPFIPLK